MSAHEDYRPADRRPIASRDKEVFKRVAHRLAVWGVSPNAISVAGMGAGVLAGIAFASTTASGLDRLAFLAAAAFMQLRLLANMFDGMVAIE